MNSVKPQCNRNDCRIQDVGAFKTLAYYAPIYNSVGENVNPDANTTICHQRCLTCNAVWKVKSNYLESSFIMTKQPQTNMNPLTPEKILFKPESNGKATVSQPVKLIDIDAANQLTSIINDWIKA